MTYSCVSIGTVTQPFSYSHKSFKCTLKKHHTKPVVSTLNICKLLSNCPNTQNINISHLKKQKVNAANCNLLEVVFTGFLK